MSNPALRTYLRRLAKLVQKKTDEYREQINVTSPIIIALDKINIEKGLKVLIDEVITKLGPALSAQLKQDRVADIIERYRTAILDHAQYKIVASLPEAEEVIIDAYSTEKGVNRIRRTLVGTKEDPQFLIIWGTSKAKPGAGGFYGAAQIHFKKASTALQKFVAEELKLSAEIFEKNIEGLNVAQIEAGHQYYQGSRSGTPVLAKAHAIENAANRLNDKVLAGGSITIAGKDITTQVSELSGFIRELEDRLDKEYARYFEVTASAITTMSSNIKGKLKAQKSLNFSFIILNGEGKQLNASKKEKEIFSQVLYRQSSLMQWLKAPENKAAIAELKSSKSIRELSKEAVDALFVLKTAGKYKKTSGPVTETVKLAKPKVKKTAGKTGKLSSKVAGATVVINRGNSTTNLQDILAYVQANITETVRKNMHSPRLINRTGRFADSVEVHKATQGRAGLTSFYYTYMKMPYQTFEPGFAQGSNKRDPTALIGTSIRELVTPLIGSKFRSVRT